MKKLLLAACVLFAALSTKAQNVYVQGGLNLANITENEDGETSENKTLSTFNAGVMARFGLSSIFDLETGLLFTGKGSKSQTYFTNSTEDNYVKTKFNPYYIELPLNAVVKLPLAGSAAGIFLSAGPYVAVGVAGDAKVETRLLGQTSTTKDHIQFNNDDPTTNGQEGAAYNRLKRFDYGANFGAGVNLGAVMIKANYGLGLAKISSLETNNSDDQKNKYRTLSFSIGIPLGGK